MKFYAVICTAKNTDHPSYVYRVILTNSPWDAREKLKMVLDELRADGYNPGEYHEHDEVTDYTYFYEGGQVEVVECEL